MNWEKTVLGPGSNIGDNLALSDSRIETSGLNLPLQQVPGTHDLFSFNTNVDAPNVAIPAKADADTWNRCMGHTNGEKKGLLNMTDDKGVSFKGGVLPCCICAIEKSTLQAYPNTATLNIEQPSS